MKKFVVSFISALLLSISFISVLPASAASGSVGPSTMAKQFLDYYCSYYNINISDYGYIVRCDSTSSSLRYFLILFDKSITSVIATSSCPDFGSGYGVNVSGFYGYSATQNLVSSSSFDNDLMEDMFSTSLSSKTCYFDLYNVYSSIVLSSCVSITVNDSELWGKPFKPPVNAQFDFKSDIEFFCCLNDNSSSLPVDNRVWIEVYDTLVAVESLVYKPHKYVYTHTITSSSPDVPNKHEQVIGDYLLANSVGPYYSISVDTLLHAGCKTDYYYTARAYVYNGSKPYEIANLTFKISSEGISTVDPSLKDPDNPDDPIMKTWNNDNRTYNYYNVNTGAQVDKDKLVYKFDYTLDPSVNGSGQDISEFDFNSDFSTDLTQGAGLVRTLFDKIIQSMGLSGFMITVLSVAVVGWFIFGSRR